MPHQLRRLTTRLPQRFGPRPGLEPSPLIELERRIPGFEETIAPGGSQALLRAIAEPLRAEGQARERSALLGLRARGGDIPGSFGVASLLAQLQSQSDLSQALSRARASSIEGNLGRLFEFGGGFQDFLERMAERGVVGQQERAVERGRQRRGLSLGFGPASISFQRGGVAGLRGPQLALLGEEEPEAVIPLSRILAAFGPDLIRARLEAVTRGVPSAGGLRPSGGGLAGVGMQGSANQGGDVMDLDTERLPMPFREPEPVRPQGFLEALAALPTLQAGPEAGGAAQGLALLTGLLQGIGASRFRQRQAAREPAAELVNRLNELQRDRFRAGLLRQRQPTTGQIGERAFAEEFGRRRAAVEAGETPAETRARLTSERAEAAAERATQAAERQERLARVTSVGQLVDDVRQEPAIKAYTAIRSNLLTARSGAREKSGPGDIALIFAFMRALEPENVNVVREGEFTNARLAAGQLQRFQNLPKRFFAGTQLTDEGRRFFLRQMESNLRVRAPDYELARDQYARRAKAFGVDPALVLPSLREIDEGAPTRDRVRMRAPDGRLLAVPRSKVAELKRLGAKEL